MTTLRYQRKFAAINSNNCAEHPRNNQARDTNVPRNQENYITQVSEEIERRVTKKLSQECSRKESRIFGALSKLDEILLNPQAGVDSRLVEEASQNSKETRKQMRIVPRMTLHPEVCISLSHSSQEYISGKTSYTNPISAPV